MRLSVNNTNSVRWCRAMLSHKCVLVGSLMVVFWLFAQSRAQCLDGRLLHQLEPVAAFASLRLALVQPHPLDVRLVFVACVSVIFSEKQLISIHSPIRTDQRELTNAANDARIEGRRNHRRRVLGALGALHDVHVERIIVAGLLQQQLALLDTGGMLQRIVHGWCETSVAGTMKI